MKYETRITRLTVAPEKEPIFSDQATHIEIEDEAAGEFIVIRQVRDSIQSGEVAIDREDWPSIMSAVETLMKELRP